jgi:hypothetical protein
VPVQLDTVVEGHDLFLSIRYNNTREGDNTPLSVVAFRRVAVGHTAHDQCRGLTGSKKQKSEEKTPLNQSVEK